MQIKSLVWFVTGGASGLGLATVHELVKQGGYVAVLDMNEETGARVEMEMKEVVIFFKCALLLSHCP
jgi:NAD(P)-dependent dehydrogenase (short-subunit alcohol dehydrogenase family)